MELFIVIKLFFKKINAPNTFRNHAHAGIKLLTSFDPQQRAHGYEFMETVAQDIEDHKNKIHEEELDNYNNGSREDSSEQSTQNVEPYRGPGKDSTNGEKPMQDMNNTLNQWNETGYVGISPDVAQELGVPTGAAAMNHDQMMRQMQYGSDNFW